MRVELGDLLEALIATGELDEAAGILADVGTACGRARPGLGCSRSSPVAAACCSPRAATSTAPSRASTARSQNTTATSTRSHAPARCSRSAGRNDGRRSAPPRAPPSRTRSRASRRLGAPLWAEQTRAELGRIGGRAPSGDALTEAERRIAELVAAGPHEQAGRGSPLPDRALGRDRAHAASTASSASIPAHELAKALCKQLRFPAFAAGPSVRASKGQTTGSAGTRDDGVQRGPGGVRS